MYSNIHRLIAEKRTKQTSKNILITTRITSRHQTIKIIICIFVFNFVYYNSSKYLKLKFSNGHQKQTCNKFICTCMYSNNKNNIRFLLSHGVFVLVFRENQKIAMLYLVHIWIFFYFETSRNVFQGNRYRKRKDRTFQWGKLCSTVFCFVVGITKVLRLCSNV